MALKAKISGGLLLLLLLVQMFDASLFPHTHFSGGKVVAPVCTHCGCHDEAEEPADEPEQCQAQEMFLALMSVTMVAAGQPSIEALTVLRHTELFVDAQETFVQRFEACCNNFRGPPAVA